ncbi:MAG: hypothetical protein EGP82_10120 [Odoribacter splanchnicus]|nr:hypothetical protein [Odoribacter splanchnicus]
MGKIATRQFVSTFAGGGTIPAEGNRGATWAWVDSNFPNAGVTVAYGSNKLVQQQHLIKKNLEITGIVVDGNDIPLVKALENTWVNTDIVEVSSMPHFTAIIKVANVGDRTIFPLFDMYGISNIEFGREYEPGPNDTATITYRDIYVEPDWLGSHEATFYLANEMSPNYGEIYARVYLQKLTFM